MKQMEDCLRRYFTGSAPLKSKKWKAFNVLDLDTGRPTLYLYHYHHLVLKLDVQKRNVMHEWWERPADKRGLDSAKKILIREGYLEP